MLLKNKLFCKQTHNAKVEADEKLRIVEVAQVENTLQERP